MDPQLLEVGRCYHITYTEGHPKGHYVGTARLVSRSPEHYEPGVFEFLLLDLPQVHSEWQRGYFDATAVDREVLYDLDRWLEKQLRGGTVVTFARVGQEGKEFTAIVTKVGAGPRPPAGDVETHYAETVPSLIHLLQQTYP